MDHNEAIRLQAAEKYALGELQGTSREEFEEHFFDCGECAHDMKALAIFLDNTKEVLRQQRARETENERVPERTGWFRWLKPIVAVPAFAVLLLALGYQSFVTVPHWKNAATQGEASAAGQARLFDSFSLAAANVRGEKGEPGVKVQAHKKEAFGLDFDFLPTKKFDHYLCQLQDETGRAVHQLSIPAEKENREVHVYVPNGVGEAGKYSLVVSGDPGAKGLWEKENEVSRFDFLVDFRP